MHCWEYEAMRHALRQHAERHECRVEDEMALADVLDAYRVESLATLLGLDAPILDLMAGELGAVIRRAA